jgi:hypothetical protein
MEIIYWIFLFLYLSSVSLSMAFLGVNWSKFKNKYQKNPKFLTIVIYIVNFCIMIFAFKSPFWVHMIFNVFLIFSLFIGTNFQVIGLTGGVATGKSSVSMILAENGFDIIDADKISKEVSF